MRYGIVKAHHAIMKYTALQDYNVVKAVVEANRLTVIEAKGKHWHKVEDATALMLKQLSGTEQLKLNRGLEYYFSL